MMVEAAREESICVCPYGVVGKRTLWCLLQQKVSLWTISSVNRRKSTAAPGEGRGTVCVCVYVTIIRATILPNTGDTTFLCSTEF